MRQRTLTAKLLSRILPALVLLLGIAPLASAEHYTATPIQHLVVIFQENVSFDHYFGTYPYATNPPGEPDFHARFGTPTVNGLLTSGLLNNNPNSANPQRLDRVLAQLVTCDQDHGYKHEQSAFDHGLMDKFVETLNGSSCSDKTIVMDYYDGNVVTALWNYAQRFAMSDNSYNTTFGPSSPGAINLVSGDTGNVDMTHTANNPSIATSASPNADLTADGLGGYSLTSDAQP